MQEIINLFIYILAMFFLNLLYNLSYAKLNNYNMKFSLKNVLVTFIGSVVNFLNISYINLNYKIIVSLIIFIVEFKIIFKDNFKKIIVNYIFIFLLLSLIEIVIVNSFLLFGVLINNKSANSISYTNMILTSIVGIIEYILVNIKKVKKLFQKFIQIFIQNLNLINFLFIVFLIITIIGMININNFANKNSIQLLFVLLIIFFFLFVSVIQLKLHEKVLNESNKKLISYNDNYGKFLDEYKIYKHNINHKLIAMKTYGNKKINALIDELLNEENNFNIKNNNLYNVPNGIKGIIAEKLYNKDFNILITNTIKKDPFSKLNAKAFNSISECIGIALDNAIEASQETEEPLITLELNEDVDNIYIKIGNNFNNSIDLEKIGNKYYSTKNRGSGLGLFSIIRNNLVKEKLNIINDFYYIELQIKKAR